MTLISSKPKELNKEQADKLNSLLPESFRKDTWEVAKIKNYDGASLQDAVRRHIKLLENTIDKMKKDFSIISSNHQKKLQLKSSYTILNYMMPNHREWFILV